MRWRPVANLALQLAVLSALIAAFFIRLPQVSGLSMEPHILSGEYVMINTFAYRLGTPHRGDIVAFRHEGDARAIFIKRVIGVPGDRIRIDRGIVILNGTKLDEPYVLHSDGRSFPEIVVPGVLRVRTWRQSRRKRGFAIFGAVSDGALLGRAVAGIWPPRMLGGL